MSWTKIAIALPATLAVLGVGTLSAQEQLGAPTPTHAPPPAKLAVAGPPEAVHLTLVEAKQRALSANKLLNLANMNAAGKEYAIRAAQALYGPQVAWLGYYLHFDHDLGSVLTLRGRPRLGLPPRVFEAAFLNQNSPFSTVYALQPLTDLAKVRQGVRIAKADEAAAQAEIEKGTRALMFGVEQLYWGWLASQRIRAGALEGLKGAEMLAATPVPEAKIALIEAKQGLQEVDNQIADIEEQLRNLLGLPPCTPLFLEEPPLPELAVACADEVAAVAVANSPEIRSAATDVEKARAATRAAKLEYVPSIALIGGYANQEQMDYIQPNFAYVGFIGTYTFVDWGKRRAVIHERENMIAMAQLKLQQTEDEVRQKATKAFRELQQNRAILKTAQEMAGLRKDAAKKAMTPEAMKDPTALMAATKAAGLAEVDLIKAEMNYRVSAAQVLSLMGR